MKCLHPLDATLLADYWLAALAKHEEEAVEQHLFACDECGARLREVIALAEESASWRGKAPATRRE
jgi:anti-sigma factor RsiW